MFAKITLTTRKTIKWQNKKNVCCFFFQMVKVSETSIKFNSNSKSWFQWVASYMAGFIFNIMKKSLVAAQSKNVTELKEKKKHHWLYVVCGTLMLLGRFLFTLHLPINSLRILIRSCKLAADIITQLMNANNATWYSIFVDFSNSLITILKR